MLTLLDDLRGEIEKRRVVVIVGAGVSIAATGNAPAASWMGLLHLGINRCAEIAQSQLPEGWRKRVQAELEHGDLDDWLSVAQKISSKLGYPGGGEYRRWLRETVGALQPKRREVIEAILSLKLPIATTNYDGLIEHVSGLPQVTWKDSARAERLLRGDDPGVLHLHGCWGDPSSVVLGISSYEKLLGDEHAQAMQRALRAFRSLLFVGCGAGLADPNFGTLLRWSREVFKGSEYRHFRLALNTEVIELQQQHPAAERVFVLGFGAQHSDLAFFLRQLAPPSDAQPDDVLSPALATFRAGQSEIDRRIAELEGRRTALTDGGYLRELSQIAFDLWQLGGKRRAWFILASTFDREASQLGSEERLEMGLKLAGMMLDDDEARSAAGILSQIQPDADRLTETDPRKADFWQMQSRCFVASCAYDQAIEAIRESLRLTRDQQTRERLEANLLEVHFLQGDLQKALDSDPDTRSTP